MIEDKNIIQGAAPLEKVETMADPGKAEPGRDIFAGEPEKDMKSSNIAFPPADSEHVREQKEISSVNVGISLSSSSSSSSSSSTTTTAPTTSDGTTEGSDGSAASETASATRSDSTIESTGGGGGGGESAAKVQVAGPLGEAELEAQKVANELYPDAEN